LEVFWLWNNHYEFKVFGSNLSWISKVIFNVRLLLAFAFSKELPWLAQTSIITLKTQLHAENARWKRLSQLSLKIIMIAWFQIKICNKITVLIFDQNILKHFIRLELCFCQSCRKTILFVFADWLHPQIF